MPLPMATRSVHISIVDPPTGTAASGTVRFRLRYALHDATDNVSLSPGDYTAALVAGEATIALPVNDEAGITPTGWSYEVEVRTTIWAENGYAAVPSGVGTLELSDIFPSATPTTVNTYATVGALASHEADTTNIHGIVDTAALLTSTLVDAKGDLYVGTADNTVARLAVGTGGYIPVADPAAASGLSYQPYLRDDFTAGTTTMDRRVASVNTVTATTGTVRLAYFTAPRAEPIANISTVVGSTAAAATPTLCRMGVYSVAANGDLTLVGACANDTTLFATINTRYARGLTASYNAVLGQRYAVAVLTVSGAATATFVGIAPNAGLATPMATSPRMTATLTGQSDLPASISSGSLTTTSQVHYGEVYP